MVDVDVRAGDPAVLLHHLNWRAAAAVIVAADVLAGQLGDADERAAQEEEAGGESVEQLEEKGRNTVEVTYIQGWGRSLKTNQSTSPPVLVP